MADFANDKGIRFEYKSRQQARFHDAHEFYSVHIPDGLTVDDAMAIVTACGYKTQTQACWNEPYARIHENSTIRLGQQDVRPNYELIITFPYLD